MKDKLKKQRGFIKEIIIVVVVIYVLAKFGLDPDLL